MTFPEDGAMDGIHDRTALVADHAFKARGEWWSVCEICGLARAAHTMTHADGGEHAHPDAA